MKVKEIMTASPACCIAENSAFSAAILMDKLGVPCLPVVIGQITKRVVGMVSDGDLLRGVVARNILPTTISVGQLMSSPAVTCGPDTSIEDCTALMLKHDIREMPVVDRNGACVGIISQTEIAAKSTYFQGTSHQLRARENKIRSEEEDLQPV